ncbi:MAG TPA: energy-coupling factor transporter transmembrane component T [Ktedonobacteraceae bacterium]|jgi:energy-coupling factor transport system permease protein
MLINFVYIQRDTPIHRLDPRVKFALLMAYALSVAQTSNLWFVLGGFVGTLLYYRASQLRWAETRRTWIFVLFLCFIFTVVNYVFSGGANVQGVDMAHPHILFFLPSLGLIGHWPFLAGTHLPLSVESLTFMLTQALRIISVVLLALPITYTTNPNQFGVAFRGMGLGDKVSYAIDLSFRFLPTTVRDFLNTLDAQRARGFEIERLHGGIFGKAARLAPMLVPVIIGSLVGAEDIICAMELRCFGVTKRTWLVELHTRSLDRLFLWLCLVGLLLVTALDIAGAFMPAGPLHVLHTQGLPAFLTP